MALSDFSRRATAAELMDTEPCSFEDFRACLADLARVNLVTLAPRPTLAFLDRLAARALPEGRPLEILDVGCGYGDGLRKVARWARRRGIAVKLVGIDRNPLAVRAAAAASGAESDIRWVAADVFAYASDEAADVVLSSLFAHHLADEEVVRFIGWMEHRARLGWLVNDLHRHRLAYHSFRLLARAAAWHRFVQHDGPLSIARSFVVEDWQRLTAAAGLPPGSAAIRPSAPFRLCLERIKAP